MLGAQALRTKQKVDKKEKDKRKAAKSERSRQKMALKRQSEDWDTNGGGGGGMGTSVDQQQQQATAASSSDGGGGGRSSATVLRSVSAHERRGDDASPGSRGRLMAERAQSPRSAEYERAAKLVTEMQQRLSLAASVTVNIGSDSATTSSLRVTGGDSNATSPRISNVASRASLAAPTTGDAEATSQGGGGLSPGRNQLGRKTKKDDKGRRLSGY